MQHRDRDSASSYAFLALFVLATLTAALWLVAGLLPALTSGFAGMHSGLHGVRDSGAVGEIASNIAQASHGPHPFFDVFFDYAFSLFNIGMALILIRVRPKDLTARLLGIALVGTAVAFNLQSHGALQVAPEDARGPIDTWHITVHVASGLCYMFALVLFPDGKLPNVHRYLKALAVPVLGIGGLFAAVLALVSTDDHTTGLVILFGIFVPVVGLVAQVAHRLTASSHEQRQQSKLLIGALLVALGFSILVTAISGGEADPRSRTEIYEFHALPAGEYFFRCDPHPVDMTGTLVVKAGGPTSIEVSAEDSRFDQSFIQLSPDAPARITFTNQDADLHNIAIYVDHTASESLFIGSEFSGSTLGIAAFRIFRLPLSAIPVALLIGLVRFNLWNVDRLIRRALVYSGLGGLIFTAYVGAIVGVGALAGSGTVSGFVLSLGVTALFAAALQPLRAWIRRVADRSVYGRRATPYEALSELSKRVGDTYAVEDVAPRLAEAIGQGTTASMSEVWLKVGGALVLAARWPEAPEAIGSKRSLASTADGTDLGSTLATPVEHRGELLGSLSITKPPGEVMTPVEEELLRNVASQAGLVLHNARLTAELEEKLTELRASRQRIVSTQDAERRRIERDIHDGAQQYLVAMSAKLRLAQDLATNEPERAAALLEELQSDTQYTLDAVRDLARGIYPPVLADKGLLQALEAHARRCPVPVRVSGADLGRHPLEAENAIYFCCLEAIQNSIKHAGGPIEISLLKDEDWLHFSVQDQGPGFDPAASTSGSGLTNMSDRVHALRGELTIESSPDGTVVRGRIPLR